MTPVIVVYKFVASNKKGNTESLQTHAPGARQAVGTSSQFGTGGRHRFGRKNKHNHDELEIAAMVAKCFVCVIFAFFLKKL